MTAPAHISQPPQLIAGRYRVLEELGRGGMAVVYRVHDVSTARELALKQLAPASQAHTQQTAELFEREYRALAQLAHPRVIAVYDYGLDAAGRFYTMELLAGGDLKQLSPLPPRRSCQLMLEVCSSLAFLHSRRLVHRDVTPRNVRCTRDGHAKLIDFGSMTPMGACSNVAGTPAFIAPEVVQRVSLDGRADLYSLGATLYYTLTGRPPFVVRHLSELREAYGHEIVAPSQLVPGIPPALDALIMALLRIDPEQRPRSAFEVMHKLEAILGAPHEEPVGVAQAYLTTPLLCGRDAQLRAFRQRIRPAIHGRGGALLFESPAGLGRSRLLDACALEAKTLGVTVLRASAGSAAPFAVAARVCEQLVEALPDVAVQAADRVQARAWLFQAAEPGAPARLIRLDDTGYGREHVLPALSAWLACICETRALSLLIDDVQRLDDASLAWLASLAVAAPELRLQLTLTAETQTQTASAAANVLARHCDVVTLQPLTHSETEVLLGSVFGKVPHLPRLAEQLYRIARGSPRETLLLAQHLVDAGAVSYRDGRWTLPEEVRSGDLPQSASEALRARITALPALARQLAQAQALLGMRSLRGAEYACLAPEAAPGAIDAALLVLLGAEILQSVGGGRFRLSQPALVDVLCRMLDEREKQAVHLRLYELHVRAGETHPLVLVPHLVAAGRHADALAIMAARSAFLDQQGENSILGLDARTVADSLERLLQESAAHGCSARAAHELRRRLCALSVVGDEALHARVGPAWLAQLCLDSGLSDYRASRVGGPAERLRGALDLARARHAAAPEPTRVYSGIL